MAAFFLPQIDDNRRIELSRDRQLAIDVERRLRRKREQKFEITPTDLAVSDINETLVKCTIECSTSNYDTSAAVDSLLDDNIPTLKEDVVDRIVEEIVVDTSTETVTEEEATIEESKVEAKPSNNVPLFLTIDTNLNPFNTDMISPSFSLHSSPSLGALDESRNQSLYFTPSSGRDLFSPIPNDQFSGARLVRSNSYTIEKPSPMLLRHLQANGINLGSNRSPLRSPMPLNEFQKNRNSRNNTPRKCVADEVEQKPKPNPTKIAITTRKPMSQSSNLSINSTISLKTSSPLAVKISKTPKSASNLKPNNQSVMSNGDSGRFRNKESILRSIYGTGKSTKVQSSAKKTNSSTTSINTKTPTNQALNKTQVIESISSRSSPNIANSNINAKSYKDILALIENQHATQMKVLLQRQQEEQKRMHAEFVRQQDELLKKITNLVANKCDKQITPKGTTESLCANEAKKSNEKMLIDEVNNEVVPLVIDTNGNRMNKFTPESSKCIRRLYYDDNKLVANELNKSYPSSLSTVSSEPFEMYTIEEVRAANIITAYTRGYLTRRLFKTTKVQNIVKTIRDTLLFILDLHYEGNENESSADIELKSHLIQQVIHTQFHSTRQFFIFLPMTRNF